MRPLNFGQPTGTDMESRISWITEALRQIESGSRDSRDLVEGYQPLTAALTAIGDLTPAADKVPYFTSATAAALATLTAFARTFLDDTTAAAALATLGITNGTYTPTLTNTTNLDASTAHECYYVRIGNTVLVAGAFQADPTAAASTLLGISLPVASGFTSSLQAAGVGSSLAESCYISSDATNDRLSAQWSPANLFNLIFYFNAVYLVV